MLSNTYTVDEIRDIVVPIAKRYGLASVWLFCSYAKNKATPNSDIDLRIDKGKAVFAIDLSGFYSDVEDALNKSVDVLTHQCYQNNFGIVFEMMKF